MNLYAIQSGDEWYKPHYGDKFWHKDLKRAKIYTNVGHAKSTITYKLETLNSLYRHYNQRWPHSYAAHAKFRSAKIVEVGTMEITWEVTTGTNTPSPTSTTMKPTNEK